MWFNWLLRNRVPAREAAPIAISGRCTDASSRHTRRRTICQPRVEELENRLLLATFTVNSTGDLPDLMPGDATCDTGQMVNASEAPECTLRAAIQEANANAGADTIEFNIAGTGPHTITPATVLPTIVRISPAIPNPVTINGYSQPGSSPNTLASASNAVLLIELNGSSAGAITDGLQITAGTSAVRGLVINRFKGDGIELSGNGGNIIEGNFIGTNVAGDLPLPNGSGNVEDAGVFINDSSDNVIGGTTPETRNVISGNDTYGVWILENASTAGAPTGNQVLGNIIGLAADGNAILVHSGGNTGNIGGGVLLQGVSNHVIGGTSGVISTRVCTSACNVISGNTADGVRIQGTSATGNKLEGNLIGTAADGDAARRNDIGVSILDASSNTIGGATADAGNLISGVTIEGSGSGNVVASNYIGTDVSGTLDRGNVGNGINISDSRNNNMGGLASAPGTSPGNLISGNDGSGVFISGAAATGNKV